MDLKHLDQTLTLSDGRILGYAQSGDPEGEVFFHFHGLYSSRLEVEVIHEEMLRSGIRVIGVDRPGMGLSSYQPHRTVLGFVDDITELADALGVDRFSLLCVSGGSAYALACCLKIPHRIKACGMVSALPPLEEVDAGSMLPQTRRFIAIARHTPWLLKPLFWFLYGRLSKRKEREEKFLENLLFYLDEADKDLIRKEETRSVLAKIFREGYRQGVEGVVDDALLIFVKPWGFQLSEIDFSPIRLWHGEKDRGVPLKMVKQMTFKLKGAVLKTYLNDGHLSIIFNHLDDIVKDIRSLGK